MNKDDIFHFEARDQNGWQILYVSLAWDNEKCTAAPFYSSHDIDGVKKSAMDAAIGRLWTMYSDEIIVYIQQKTMEDLRNVQCSDIPIGESREVLIKVNARGKIPPELHFENDDETEVDNA